MTMDRPLSTAEVAEISGCSVQQVRRLETIGVIPAAERRPNGYRTFTEVHLRALGAYRLLAAAIGPVDAAALMMRRDRTSEVDIAAALGEHAASLDAERKQVLAARDALLTVAADTGGEDPMTITELSQALGVPASTLRFWESEGLIDPERVVSGGVRARLYRSLAIRDARITAALRAGGYRIPEVRQALGALRDLGDAGASLTALDERTASIEARLRDLFRAGGLIVSADR